MVGHRERGAVLVGDGPDRHRLQAQVPPNVVFAGARSNVSDWLNAADVVAAPSRWEGMSLTVLEAMASGRSVVATDVPGMREMLVDGPDPAAGTSPPRTLRAGPPSRGAMGILPG
ncbi:MAG: glycosyltransferase family 4 protein [Planctomycetota bacterium]